MYDVPQSFKNYFQRQGKERNEEVGDCGKTMGMWLCICTLSSLVPSSGQSLEWVPWSFLILWMLKIHELKNKIIADRQKQPNSREVHASAYHDNRSALPPTP